MTTTLIIHLLLLCLGARLGTVHSFSYSSSATHLRSQHSSIRCIGQVSLRPTTSLSSSAFDASAGENEEETTEDSMSVISEEERRDELKKKYEIGTALFGFVSLALLLMPDRTHTSKLATKVGGACGYALAAGVSYILAGATHQDRLGSDTYKRLNVGLFGFSSIGLLAVPGEAAFHPYFEGCLAVLVAATVTKVFGSGLAYKGWKRGLTMDDSATPRQVWGEFVEGTKTTLSGLFETTKKALAYRNYVLLVFLGSVSAIMQGLFNMGYHAPLFPISLGWSALSRLFLLLTMIYSLKDAAERDRLMGTTFIQMNLFVGLWALLVGIGQGTSRIGFSISRTPMLLFSVPFLLEAGKYQRRKLEKEKTKET